MDEQEDPRRFAEVFVDEPLVLEAGGSLGGPTAPVRVAYEAWGTPDADRSNAVLVLHALTGDSHAGGPGGWWTDLIGPGRPLDTDRFWVVCPNVLGGCRGTTGPSSPAADGRPYGSRFPVVTVRDQVAVEAALADALGIDRWTAVVGGSMGGMRAVEWSVSRPDRVARAVLLATTAASSAEQIALCSVQIEAIRSDPEFRGGDYYGRGVDGADDRGAGEGPGRGAGEGPVRGLKLARRIGHITYRSEPEFGDRFGRRPQGDEQPLEGGRYAVESYLDHHAESLVRRFDANSYIVLSRSMNHHDVGRDRGGLAAALARVTAEATVVGIDSDHLYPLSQQRQLADLLPGRPDLGTVVSAHGHDGFLVETEQVGKHVAGALAG